MPLSRTFLLAAAAALAAGHATGQRFLMNAYGNLAGARFGAAIDRIGDVTGDGTPDVVVGSPDFSPSGSQTNRGAAALVNGRTGAMVYQTGPGSAPGAHFGATLLGTADLNGDGFPDFVVGAPNLAGAGSLLNVGMVAAFEGRTGANLWTSSAVGSNVRLFGTAIARIGDVTGDGAPDLVVGYPGNFSSTGAMIVDGRTGNWGNQIASGTATSQCGTSLATLSDLTGDGRPEVLVGEPRFNFNADSGRLRAIDPSHTVTPVYQQFQNFAYDVGAGQLLANAGDVDGDGKDDVLMTFRGSQSSGPWTPRVAVLSGVDGATIGTVWSPVYDGTFAGAISGVGDFDGDGRADFAVGSPNYHNGDGRVDVFSGRTLGLITTISGAAGSHFGAAIAPFGDFDGDGRADFLVGAPDYVYNGAAVGCVSVVSLFLPGSVTSFGTGCTGQANAPLLSRYAPFLTLPPFPGMTVTFQCTNLTGAAASLWLWGFSDTTTAAGQLPLDLGAFGFPGCNLLVSPDAIVSYGGGNRQVPMALPNDPLLTGLRFFLQVAGLGAGYANGVGFSNALNVFVGNV